MRYSHACSKHRLSERGLRQLVNRSRDTQRYRTAQRENENALTQAVIELASQYGRYRYRRIIVLLHRARLAGTVEGIWRPEGLTVAQWIAACRRG